MSPGGEVGLPYLRHLQVSSSMFSLQSGRCDSSFEDFLASLLQGQRFIERGLRRVSWVKHLKCRQPRQVYAGHLCSKTTRASTCLTHLTPPERHPEALFSASSIATSRLRCKNLCEGPGLTADFPGGPTCRSFLTTPGHEREVRPSEGYHPTSSGFAVLRRRGRCSRPGNGYPLS